jgi:hypothetical protein
MGKSVLFLVVGLLMASFVSSTSVFFDNFEDGEEWTNWEVDIDGSSRGTFGIESTSELGMGNMGNGNYFAKALHIGAGWSRLILKKPLNLSNNQDCEISFYSASSGASSPKLYVDFEGTSTWKDLFKIDLKDFKTLQRHVVPIDNSLLDESSRIRFSITNPIGYVYLDDVNIDCATEDLIVAIESPECGSYFMLDETSSIRISADDIDDVLTGNVSIDDHIEYFTNGGIEFDHTWSRSGNIKIELFAENTEGETKEKVTNVMVIDPSSPDKYLAACIDRPSELTDIVDSNVYFNANNTRGLVNESGTLNEISLSGLLFSWSFSDGLINFNHDGGATNSDGSPNKLAYEFYKNFVTPGRNWAVLNVEFKE